MPELFSHDDIALTAADIGVLQDADAIASFFHKLRYDITHRVVIHDPVAIGIGNADLKLQIEHMEQIAKAPADGDIVVYLLEVHSITVKLRNDLAKAFRDRPEQALLVLTRHKGYDDLDFVLVVRDLAESNTRNAAIKQTIRPVTLTVRRSDPGQVALRALRRLSWTEEDSLLQWDKLRSAWTTAQWSEEHFNNRALFSDYYLKYRLTDSKLAPTWDESVQAIAGHVTTLLANPLADYSGKTAAEIRSRLYEPLFKHLGLVWRADATPPADTDAISADYLLFAPGETEQPLAAALTYRWGRNLDDIDPTREADGETDAANVIPGAAVVTLLEKQIAPWMILTNGKIWRLYSATASNKATNYYEIDLEQALAANDRQTALKYWWLFFRREAFGGLLDSLLQGSIDYAKDLGERLKALIFEEVFPHFADGFLADMRRQGDLKQEEAVLREVFGGTLTFLYRLMFVLYAESLDLLPLSERHGYREQSVYTLKKEIAAAGGTIESERDAKLKAKYSASETGLYARLKNLFAVIEQGSPELNMPVYNGGLFSAGSTSGSFLDKFALPDRHLALGLDKLARALDDKTKALVFVDFKSLGVRHLGSIYEGLLEFRLLVAAEDLAVKTEKRSEVYLPAKGSGRPVAVRKGAVYLANDKRERKATGSYYTPDYIVKYIVKQTVGPVLEARFEQLRSRLNKAQKGYGEAVGREMAKFRGQSKGGDPEKFWNNDDMVQLRDDCLNMRVLDPAMGSGHFLVEAVDYISNRLIDFLNGWSRNPVWAYIDQMRRDIVADLETQNVTIDAGRLTRVALLKRAVLKRCIYGVDLNGMAVELAKVSLWLDAFTLGAPLSFLDHHLKQGNSLIGARIGEVEEALKGQASLFGHSQFVGVMMATDLMRQISFLPDNTIAQTRASAEAFRDASDHLAPYKRVLDVYTSRWFGNTPGTGKKGQPGFDAALEFLRREDTEVWLKDPTTPLPEKDYMDVRAVGETARRAATEKRFFHWELEFPEIFFSPSAPGEKDVHLNEDGGFDAVVGNPPYRDLKDLDRDLVDSLFVFYESTRNRANVYTAFVERSIGLLSPAGEFGAIVPNSWSTQSSYAGIRKIVVEDNHLHHLVRVPETAFPEQKVETTIICVKRLGAGSDELETHYLGYLDSQFINIIDSSTAVFAGDVTRTALLGGIGQLWTASGSVEEVLQKMLSRSVVLEDLCEFCLGLTPYDKYKGHSKSDIENEVFHASFRKDETFKPLLTGGGISRFIVEWSEAEWISYGPWLGAPREQRFFTEPRILVKQVIDWTMRRLHAGYTTEELYNAQIAFNLLPSRDINPLYLLAVLNSSALNFYHKRRFLDGAKVRFQKVLIQDAKKFPIPLVKSVAEADHFAAKLVIGESSATLAAASAALDEGKSDVVHDLLAFLAQRMIDLNKQKQAEVKRFLAWLEGTLRIKPKDGAGGIDSLNGKTFLQNYLGDYQKGEKERSWRDFKRTLHKNKTRYGVSLTAVEGRIEAEYEKSLAALLPIKAELERTDTLIDRIVYRLYGLTDAEIELIERPQYEQALADARAKAVADKSLDDEQRAEQIAEEVRRASEHYFDRINTDDLDTALDGVLTNWRTLPDGCPTFMRTFIHLLRTQPDDLDFTTVVGQAAKAVEVALDHRILAPFRAQHSAAECQNPFLQEYMGGGKALTLGVLPVVLRSSKEGALQAFANGIVNVSALQQTMAEQTTIDMRNPAIHSEVITRAEAESFGKWAISVLRLF